MPQFQDRTVVEKFMTKLLGGDNVVGDANKKAAEAQKERMAVTKPGIVQRGLAVGVGQAQTVWGMGSDLIHNLFGSDGGLHTGNWDWSHTKDALGETTLESAPERSQQLDMIVRQFGADGVEVGKGNQWMPLDPSNRSEVEALSAGKLNIRKKGANNGGMALGDVGQDGKSLSASPEGGGGNAFSVAPRGSAAPQAVNVGGSLTITIDQNGVAHAPSSVSLTQNQAAANVAWGGATHNNRPPGDR